MVNFNKVKNVFLYGMSRLRTKELQDEYINWLSFANAGMMNKGNMYCVDFAIQHLPSAAPIIEIGCFCGLSTNITSYLLAKHHKNNHIIACDKWIFEGAEGSDGFLGNSDLTHSNYKEFVRNSFIRNVKTFSKSNLPYAIEEFSDDFFQLWNDNKTCKDVFNREITLGGNISFAYIDGNHSYEFAKRDFLNVDKNLEPGGFVFFDDSADYYSFGSSTLMREIKRNKAYELIMKNPNYLFRKKWGYNSIPRQL